MVASHRVHAGPTMIPETIRDELESVAQTTFDEAKERIEDGEAEFDVNYANKQAIGDLTAPDSAFTHLGTGGGRAAVTHPELEPYAVKIAIYSPREKGGFSTDGISQNRREAWTWRNLPDGLQSRFTPVEDTCAGHRLLVMPTVTTDSSEVPYEAAVQFAEETQAALRRDSWDYVELDVNTIGKRAGRYEVYDYGLPVKPADELNRE